MAEPLTILGAAAATLQFSEFAGKIVYTAYSLYNSAAGNTTTNVEIEDATRALAKILDRLKTDNDSSSHAGQDNGLAEIVTRCQDLGGKLLVLMEKTKAKKARSLRESFKAATKTVWTKTAVDGLRAELETCMNQLGVYLVATLRSETGEKLEEILNASLAKKLEINLLRQTISKVQHDQRLTIESLTSLREIFNPSDPVLQDLNQRRILKRLSYQRMGVRFEDVSRATGETFKWCLHDLKLPKYHPELTISFQDWLLRGRGIFYISAKPGAGKSTLMKFIVSHDDTTRYLEEWAGATRTLVVANFFFWKLGKEKLEKNLEGLIRSLVYKILETLPDMIPITFPQYWDPSRELPWQEAIDLQIPFLAVLAAFEKLIEDNELMKGHCFCLFIDGLDEFEDDDPEENHRWLAERLQAWTNRNPENVKICVSGREENSFIKTFSSSQRLRLHFLTKDDIRKTIESTLSRHGNFRKESTRKREKLVDTMVIKAEGVFLWVRLVLKELLEELDDERPFKDLYETLSTVPNELEDLFSRILLSIRKTRRKEAWAILAVLMATTELGIENIFIFQASFIKHFLESNKFSNELGTMSQFSLPEIAARIQNFIPQLNGLFKGLIEVDDTAVYDQRGDSKQAYFRRHEFVDPRDTSSHISCHGSPKFTHRSIYDFLRTECPTEIRDFMKNFDVKLIMLQCLTAHVVLVPWDIYIQGEMGLLISTHLKWLQKSCSTDKHLEQLGILDDFLLQKQEGCSSTNGFDWSEIQGFSVERHGIEWPVSVLSSSFFLSFENYITWASQHRAHLFVGDRTQAELCWCLLNGNLTISDPSIMAGQIQCLQYLVKDGFVTNDLTTVQIRPELDVSLWQMFAIKTGAVCISSNTTQENSWSKAMEVLLKLYVDPLLIFHLDKERLERKEFVVLNVEVEVEVRHGPKLVQSINIKRRNTARAPGCLRAVMSFREIIELANPANCEELLRLIDRNLAVHEKQAISVGPADASTADGKSNKPGTNAEVTVEELDLGTVRARHKMNWAYLRAWPNYLYLAGISGLIIYCLIAYMIQNWSNILI